ncbi:MAG: Patatin [Bradyrhizobium sp.]|nr:Patatin [Bradyrhizobium sp.]
MATNLGDSSKSGRALVLGGGGPVGRAWQSGLAVGLGAKGVALGTADLILGTSAGAIVGAQLALGLDFINAAPPPGMAPPVAPSPEAMGHLAAAMARAAQSPTPEVERQAIGQFALTASSATEEDSIRRVGFLANRDWPANFRATAVDVGTGKHVVWGRGSGAPLERAVASSCALPGVWPPITIDGARYMDGGIRSMLNADLAAGFGAVIIISCFALAPPEGAPSNGMAAGGASLLSEIASLRASGSLIDFIGPDEAFWELTQHGTKMLDGSLAPVAFHMGMQQGAEEAAGLNKVWRQV